MQGPYTLSEPVSSNAEFAFFLVDAANHYSPVTSEGGEQPQIRKAGDTTWTDTSATLLHIGNGHYTIVLTPTELDTLGLFSIRYKSANTDEFQDTGKVQASSGEVSLDEVNAKLDALTGRINTLEFLLKRAEDRASEDNFLSPLDLDKASF